MSPRTDNVAGRVSNLGLGIIGLLKDGPKGSGTVLVYHMVPKLGTRGSCDLSLTDVVVADTQPREIAGVATGAGRVVVEGEAVPTPNMAMPTGPWATAAISAGATAAARVSRAPDINVILPLTSSLEPKGATQVVLDARWGNGPGEFGRRHPAHTNGPKSFDVDDRGNLFVLDQENGRVQRFDSRGSYLSSFPAPAESRDIGLAEDGSVYLLVPGQMHTVLRQSSEGAALGQYLIPGEVGPVLSRGLAIVGNDLYLGAVGGRNDHPERWYRLAEGGRVLPIQDQMLSAMAAKPLRFGGLAVEAVRSGQRSIGLSLARVGSPESRISLTLGERDSGELPELEADRFGMMYVGIRTPLRGTGQTALMVIGLTSDGQYVGRAEVGDDCRTGCINSAFRGLRVGRDGILYRLSSTSEWVRVERWSLQR